MTVNDNEASTQTEGKNENQTPSIFRLSLLEIILGLVTGALITLSYRSALWNLQPFASIAPRIIRFNENRNLLFASLAWFYFLAGFIAAVSLIRLLRKQHHLIPYLGEISSRGYLALIWPLPLIIPGIKTIFSLSLFICWPIILVIAGILCVYSIREYDNKGDRFPIIFNAAASLLLIYNTVSIWDLIGQ